MSGLWSGCGGARCVWPGLWDPPGAWPWPETMWVQGWAPWWGHGSLWLPVGLGAKVREAEAKAVGDLGSLGWRRSQRQRWSEGQQGWGVGDGLARATPE